MSSRILVFLGVVLAGSLPFTIGACSQSGSVLPSEESPAGQMSVHIPLSKAVAAAITRAEVVITGSGISEMRQNLTVTGNAITGIVRDIPSGTRVFTLNAYDSSGALTYSGAETAVVVTGEEITVRITMRSVSVQSGTPEIRMRVPVNKSGGYPRTYIKGVIENVGNADADDVVIWMRAWNESNEPITDASVDVGIIAADEDTLYTVQFDDTNDKGSLRVSKVEYKVTYKFGVGPDPEEGSIEGTIVLD